MRAVILDTDVFSFVFKRDSRAELYSSSMTGAQPCLSFQSVAELRFWALARRWSESRRQGLDTSIAQCVVIPYDDAMAKIWAEICVNRRQIGRPIECGDAWIAAAALRHQCTLLTHNAKDYAGIPDLKIISFA